MTDSPSPAVSAAAANPSKQAVGSEVSPLELLFDLVFVFAVSQLSHHLAADLSWTCAGQTAVMLVGVFCVWSYTSFEATALSLGRTYTQVMMLTVMALGLFMNAAISRAFGPEPWAFVVPLLLIQLGRPALTGALVPGPLLPGQYRQILAWIVATTPLWIAGALAEPSARLGWWAAAALVDLAGTWLAHPTPRRVLRSQDIAFDAEHMVERCRLFLIIALGETVLLTGTALATARFSPVTALTGLAGLVTVVALWALYFAGSDHLVNQHLEVTTDPIRAARLTMNGLIVGVAALIALGVGSELVITNPGAPSHGTITLLLFGGSLTYLATQTWHLQVVLATTSPLRWAGMATLLLAGAACWAGATAATAAVVMAGILAGLFLVVVGENTRRAEATPT